MSAPLASARVLLVEDDPDIRAIARIALADVGGLEVDDQPTGEAALAAFARHAPDIVLLDVMMPGMDGLAVLKALRTLPGGAEVPVLFVTARVRGEDIARYRAMGAAAVIAKPFDPMTLADEVRRHLAPVKSPYAPVVERFLDGLGDRLNRLGAAVASGARPALRQEAHSLAGTAGSVGFPALGEAARRLEEAVLNDRPDETLGALTRALVDAARDLRAEDSDLLRR